MKTGIMAVALIAACVLSSGCASKPFRMGAIPGKAYDVLGPTEGQATGALFTQLIPVRQNTRFERAYLNGVNKLKGDDLINIQISERWFYFYFGNGFVTRVTGDAIKYRTKDDPQPQP